MGILGGQQIGIGKKKAALAESAKGAKPMTSYFSVS